MKETKKKFKIKSIFLWFNLWWIKSIDLEKFHITYKLKDSFDIKDGFKTNTIITQDEKNNLSSNFYNTDYSIQLSLKTEKG